MPSDATENTDIPEAYLDEPETVSRLPRLKLWHGLIALSSLAGLLVVGLLVTRSGPIATLPEPYAPPLAATLVSADTDNTPARTLEVSSDILKRRETLINVVTRLGAEHGEAHNALQAAFTADMLDPRRLRPGHQVKAYFSDTGALTALSLREDASRSILITQLPDGSYKAHELSARLTPGYTRIAGTIETSLYEDARALGAADQQVVDYAGIYAYDIDFQREIHPGDAYEIMFEVFKDERGRTIKTGKVVFAGLNGKALKRNFYRFTPEDDPVTDFYDASGESATRFLMKTPINGARLSSHYGRRRHPISGYSRLHKGTDFAAPSGTPVYAAGHGTIERASRYGGYGKYVRIRHANGYKTAYAHMSRYGRGIRKGKRVRQGDIIGYVGSTGASTGPHLHYEVLVKGRQVNAMKLNFPTGRKLAAAPDIFKIFQTHRQTVDATRRELGAELDVASVLQDATTH